ncbi:VaFE repeat-containing surface-anchored protein, partial [[Clostridium] innocuum]|uniref:VaFE repeat-containing surface-anchored protein n=8 Tax=Bacillota TaxID=1239 RepID=UPI0013928845
ISKNHAYLLRQLVVWQRLSVHLGWQCDNVRASYDEIPKATQDEVFSGARAFVKENKGRYECGGYIYSGEGQELGQFWAKLNVGNAKLQKASSNTSITDGNGNYSIAGATYGVFADKDCTKQLATLTTDENGNMDVAEVTAGTVYIKELSAPAGYKVDKTVYPLAIKAGEIATLKVSMSADQISDVALSIEYVKQYTDSHSQISKNHAYLLRQLVVWQRLSVHLGWQCDNVRASYDEIPKATQDEVFAGARAFVKENKGRYECGGYIYSGEGQELGQFWAKLNVGNAKLQKASSNTSITDGNGNYSIAGATYGVFADKDCTKQLATLTTDENGNTDVAEVKAGTVYIKELSAPAGYKVDKTVYSLKVEAGTTATLNVSDTPKVTDTLIELFKIDMETQKDNPQGNASLAGAEFTWKYYAGFYNKDNLPAEATRTWVTKTIAETDGDGTTHYITKLADAYKVSGDSFYMQDGKAVLPLGTLTVEETKAPNGYLLDGAYMQAGDKSEQIKGLYVTQITEDGDLAVLSGSNQFSVSDKVIRGGVKIQKRDLETGDTKPQGSATLKDTAFDIISLNENAVLVEGKLYKKNEVVKTIRTDIEGITSTSADLLPYGKFRIVESEAPNGYLTDGAKPIDFTITENGKIVDLTDEAHSIYNQIKRGDIEGVKIGAGTHKRLADVPFRITSKTTGENHVVVTDDNGQFSTSADWASHKHNTNAGKTSEDGVWFGTSEPDDSKGALPYDTYIIEEMRCDSNKGFELIPPFEIVVSRNNLVVDLGTLTDEYEKEISIHTTATSKDGEKTILAGKEVTIVDTVKLDGLTKGTKYQLKGWQMLKEENTELIIDGKRVENDYTFVADDEEMKVEISYTFNASALGGKNLVTFEELYDFSNPDEPVKVAEHKDIEDDGQTVLITERIIKIHTTATDKDGNKELEAGKDVTFIDTVTLEGLEVGTQYKLVGWQMLREENAELLINGKRVESDYTFIADSETMKVEVAFTFDATSLDGKQLVTFEELYDLSNPDEPKKVTEHKDIEDKGQTITFKEKPEEPEKPETPPTPEKPNRPSDSPKTGDNTNLYGLLALLLTSGAGLAGIFFYKRRKMKKS